VLERAIEGLQAVLRQRRRHAEARRLLDDALARRARG
jgi:hypothetical protein